MGHIPTIPLACLLLAAGLAGCVADSGVQSPGALDTASTDEQTAPTNTSQGPTEADTPSTNATDPDLGNGSQADTSPQDPEEPPEPPRFVLRFTEADLATHELLSANGTITPEGFAEGQGPESSDQVRLSLADKLPAGVPAHLQATLTYERTRTGGGPTSGYDQAASTQLTLDLDAPATAIRYLNASQGQGQPGAEPGGTETVRAHLEATVIPKAGDTVAVTVDPERVEPPEGTNYTLEVRVDADPTRLAPRVPVAAHLEPGQGPVELESHGDGQLLIWDPDDRFQGRMDLAPGTLTLDLRPTDPLGEYVFLLLGAPQGVSLETAGPDEPMRVLDTTVRTSDAQAVEPQPGEAPPFVHTWTTNVFRVPLAAGVYLTGTDPATNASTAADLEVRLKSPTGTVVSHASALAGGMDTDGAYTVWQSPVGHEHLVRGAYQGTVTAALAPGLQVGTWIVHYQR